MANLVITVDGDGYKVESNDINTGWDIYYFLPINISEIYTNSNAVIVVFKDRIEPWELTLTSTDGEWKVDTILGLIPATIDDLLSLMNKLRIKTRSLEDSNLNTNDTNSATAILELGETKQIGLYVQIVSGTVSTCVIEIQVRADSTTEWQNTGHIVTGEGHSHDNMCIGGQIRAKVQSAQGAISVVKVNLIAK